ncbi:MAG TPA: HypC/HybG/HupF family hydrogenase formation chaperone [Stellaceae bacterium]|nr:HypC/HybG/HupF family hydrogenase formation chaperone [Stellaceae bacterium]
MCLAVPGRIESVEGGDELTRRGRVAFGGIVKQINLACVPDAGVGDYVLVHAGVAIAVIDEAEASRTFAYLQEIEAIEEEGP